MLEARRTPLPIDPFVPRITDALRSGSDVILVAEPGAGKTTRVAPAIIRSSLLSSSAPQLVMLQPRRVAARAAAARIAFEQGWRLGKEVGYQVRHERVLGSDTPLRVITEGILVRRLVADPELGGVGCVILDEFHERSIHSDLSLAMLREAKEVRPDLRLVVMSATLDADAVAGYLQRGGRVEVFHVPGRLFGVEVEYAGDSPAPVEERIAAVLGRELPARRAAATQAGCPGGDVLVFLPGVREIERSLRCIEGPCADHGYDALALHGSLTRQEQDIALDFDPRSPPRVICATNIAETSLTLPGVRLVIDSGLVRLAGYDAARGLETLTTQRISKASAQQRRGRAGRVAAGRCIRLWSAMTHHRLPDFDVPEVRRVDLAEALLAVFAWGGDPSCFAWFEPPEPRLLAGARKLLEMIGAVESGRLTALGRELQRLPLHPRQARLLTAAPPQLASEAATVAALLAEGAEVPGRRTGNVRELLEVFELRQLDFAVGRAVSRARDALLAAIQSSDVHAEGVSCLEELLLLAYPDRVCKRRDDPGLARLVEGGGVRLPDPAAVRSDLFLALDVRQSSTAQKQQADVRLVAGIEEAWLERDLPQNVVIEETAGFDPASKRVVAIRRKRYRDLILSEEPGGTPDVGLASRLLAENLPASGGQPGDRDDVAIRLEMLRRHLPSHLLPPALPATNPGPEEIATACRRAAESGDPSVHRAGQILREMADHQLAATPWRRLLDQHAPLQIQTPTGSRARLDWSAADPEAGRGPVMAVRLQELFGLAQTPRICGGAVPVILHLLGPNFRPVQVTDDLASFWRNTYPQVRKDLRARYPRHSWPEDPLSAAPSRGAQRRRPAQ